MHSFHGDRKLPPYFEGWYLKHQGQDGAIALIPAYHFSRNGQAGASLQVLTNEHSFSVPYTRNQFYASRNRFLVRLGNNVFSERGCHIDCQTEGLSLHGTLHYGIFSPPATDIMGPFRRLPFMQCRHSIFSMTHPLRGTLVLNGKDYVFDGGVGYMEGDRGSSFPSRYLWTQCNWDNNSLMLSVADIPFYGAHFTGCIGFLFLNGREIRLATYCGAKVLYAGNEALLIQQGELLLLARPLKKDARPLRAPSAGEMCRTIHESISAPVQYKIIRRDKVLLNLTCETASFEAAWE